MSLAEIKNKLYQKEPDKNLGKHDPSSFDIRTGGVSSLNKFKTQEEWEEAPPLIGEEQNKSIKWGALVIAGILGVALLIAGVLKFSQASFNENRVSVNISGPVEGESGSLMEYVISYKNDNRVALKNVVLHVGFPESFKAETEADFKKDGDAGGRVEMGEIKAGASGQYILKGRAYDPRGTVIYVKADLNYTPSNFNSQFSAKSQLGIRVTSTPIEFEVLAPQYIASGDAVDYLISYKNTGQADFNDLHVKIDYPESFIFSKSSPSVSEGNNIWYIGRLAAGASGKIVVSGKLEGTRDEAKNATAYIGKLEQGEFISYNEEKAVTNIAASPLVIAQVVNGLQNLNVKAGDTLRFEIAYKNDSELGYRDAIVTEKIDSPVLDYSTLRLDQGAFNSDSKTITWKAADFANLRFLGPGQAGLIRFSIKVKDVIPITGPADKNFVISALAKIDSPDIPTPIKSNKVIAGNEMDMKLTSKIVIETKGFYYDPVIPNSGPLPAQVGKETTYTIHWLAENVSNDVTGAKIETVLPTGVSMTGKIYPEDARLAYNERNNTIVWEIGNISAGTGVISSPKEAVFQIKFVPSPEQGGASSGEILNPSVFSAKDTFTGEDLSVTSEKKSTILIEDAKMDASGYRVLPAS
jgi:hypothetical protein